MSSLLQGKTALVLGIANKWSIAHAITQAFRREGATVILTYQGERLERALKDIGNDLGAAKVFQCDVSKDDDLANLAATLAPEFPKIDIVVHSIAFANSEDLSRPFVQTSRDGFKLAHEVSAWSLVGVANAVRPLMTDGGAIMTLSYLGAQRVIENYNVMGVAKAALEASMRYLAGELGSSNIRVNAISAGPIKTAAARGIKDFSKILDGIASKAPLRRNCTPAEVADTAVFLASDLGRGVTGNTIFVDSGYQIMGL
jgi:enoyl-[acyl-carrier protein] reductase I